MRFTSIVARLNYTKDVLTKFINGETQKIEELEEERLPVFKNSSGKIVNYATWNKIALGGLDRL